MRNFLASAHILWETGILRRVEEARIHTRSGLITAVSKGGEIELNFPAKSEEPADAPAGLLESLRVSAKYIGKSKFDYLVQVDSEETVRGLNPDFASPKSIPVRGVIVTSRAVSPGYDFISRFFAPAAGVNEDPVTGLGPLHPGALLELATGEE